MEELKARAEELGLEFKGNISKKELSELIADAENGVTPELKEAAQAAESINTKLKEVVVETEKPVSAARTVGQIKADARKEANKLVRCIVTAMDKDKADLHGEIISCGNSMTGMIKKFIPFGTEWHVPKIIVDTLISKKMLTTRDRKTPKGIIKENVEIMQYNVQILPDLTQEELDRLQKEAK